MTTLVANLGWNPNSESNLAGYQVSLGRAPGVYDAPLDVGNVTATSVALSAPGLWVFNLRAYNTGGLISEYGHEISGTFAESEPPRPSAPIASTQTMSVQFIGTPPDTTSGWAMQLQDVGVWIGSKDNAPPYVRTISLKPGAHSLVAVWTKPGVTVVSQAVTVEVPA